MMPSMRMCPPPPPQHLPLSHTIDLATKTSTIRAMRVPKFLRSLYDILHYEDQTILTWSKDGTYFQIFDTKRLEIVVLPKYFKHGKFASFQRQLNNFGFRKWTKTQSSVCTFSHHHLVRCHPQQLAEFISRRPEAVGTRPATVAASVRRKRSFTELMQAPVTAESVSPKMIKRENEAYGRRFVNSVMTTPYAGKTGSRELVNPLGLKSNDDIHGTPTSSSSGPTEQAFNFSVDELHDIILPISAVSERYESRSLERVLELRMLNECLDIGSGSNAVGTHIGAEFFPVLPYSWDSDTFFAPVGRANFEQDRRLL